jgi:hypothetical protein
LVTKLTDRQQRVALHSVFSEWLPVTSGVTDGCMLIPLVFLVYCNNIPTYIKKNSKLVLFADDSKLHWPLLFPYLLLYFKLIFPI